MFVVSVVLFIFWENVTKIYFDDMSKNKIINQKENKKKGKSKKTQEKFMIKVVIMFTLGWVNPPSCFVI